MSTAWKYIAKRIAQIVGVVFLLSVATFILSVNAKIDPVDLAFAQAEGTLIDHEQRIRLEEQKEAARESLGVFLPTFYVSLTPLALTEEVRSLRNKKEIEWVTERCYEGFDCGSLIQYALQLRAVTRSKTFQDCEDCQIAANKLKLNDGFEGHKTFLSSLAQVNPRAIEAEIAECQTLLAAASEQGGYWKVLVPTIRFHRVNRYHQWLFGSPNTGKGFIRGDFGKSIITKKKVSKHIGDALPWTLTLSLFSILISLTGSIIIGVFTAYFHGSIFDRLSHSILFLLFTIPSFWFATLLLMYFTNPDYFNWFPSGGVAPLYNFDHTPSTWERIAASTRHMILPLVCMSYGGLTYLSRLTRSSAIEAFNATYTFSARSRGLKEQTIVFKHVLKNSLLPLITVTGSILPALFAGSLIIEQIFSVPGLGNEAFNASNANDLNLLMAIFTISGLLSAIGYLVSDLLYKLVDPRIQLKDM